MLLFIFIGSLLTESLPLVLRTFAHDGISPQRTSDRRRTGSLESWRMTGTGCVGAMLSANRAHSDPESGEIYTSHFEMEGAQWIKAN